MLYSTRQRCGRECGPCLESSSVIYSTMISRRSSSPSEHEGAGSLPSFSPPPAGRRSISWTMSGFHGTTRDLRSDNTRDALQLHWCDMSSRTPRQSLQVCALKWRCAARLKMHFRIAPRQSAVDLISEHFNATISILTLFTMSAKDICVVALEAL